MPDLNFNTTSLDIELLPSHRSQIETNQELIHEVTQYFGEAMKIFINDKISKKLANKSLIVHRAFFGCISHHHDTKKISIYTPDGANESTPASQFCKEGGQLVDYTSFMVTREDPIISGPPQYFIKFHHDQNLPIGYFDDAVREFVAIGDDAFQEPCIVLLQKMLQSGFLGFLQGHSTSLTSHEVSEILSRNLPRMGEKMVSDIENALQHVKREAQTLPPTE